MGYEVIVINNVGEELKGKKSKMKEKEEFIPIKPAAKIKLSEETLAQVKRRGRPLEQYSRFSAIVSDAAQTHKLQSNKEIMKYDIISVQPTSEKTFLQACSTLDVDLISLDFTEKLPFFLKRQQIGTAIERGVHFEILYSPAIRDFTARRNIIANAQNLMNICKGKNIIISSGCAKSIELRGPYDVSNLALLFGLTQAQAKDAITTNCRSVIMHGKSRKTTSSVLSVTKALNLPPKDFWKIKDSCSQETNTTTEATNSEGEEEGEEPPIKKIKS